MMRYFVFLLLVFGLISCGQPQKTSQDSPNKNKPEKVKTVAKKEVTTKPASDDRLDKNMIRIALRNKDSVKASQKATMDSLLEDVGQRYAMQDAMGKFKKGVEFFEAQDLASALEQFKLALANIPRNPKVNYYLGLIYYEYGQYDLSLSYYSDAVRFDPIDSLALLGVGQIYFVKNDLKNALDYYDLAVQAGPNYATAYYNRGTVYGMQNNYIEALNDLNKATELNPNYAAAYLNKGNAYFMLKQANSACQNWKKAADLGDAGGMAAFNKHCK